MNFKVNYSIKDLLDHGVHFGHRKKLWNPKMQKYIYGVKDNVHIIDLVQTSKSLSDALSIIYNIVSKKGTVLFVNTKKQSQKIVREEALRCGHFFINNRWLGGTLTNWSTISSSIKTLQYYEDICNKYKSQYTKKEILTFTRKKLKLDRDIGGVRNMSSLPDILFVIDVKLHAIAVKEANIKGIPVVAIVDTNSSPDNVDFIIAGNDDSRKSIGFYCRLVSDTIIAANKSVNVTNISE